MGNLYIHIGTHKTGTSSIQNFFKANRELLAETYEVCYPLSGMNSIGSHHNLLYQINRDERYIVSRGGWGDLELEIKGFLDKATSADFLLSCEAFSSLKNIDNLIYKIKCIAEDNHLKAIPVLFLRPFPDFVESIYIERLKGGGRPVTFSSFLKQSVEYNSFSYSEIVNCYSNSFDDLVIFPYDGTDSVTRLLNYISPSASNEDMSVGSRCNERISKEHLALIAGHSKSALSSGLDKKTCREFSRFFRKQCGFKERKESFSFMTLSDKELIDEYLKVDLSKIAHFSFHEGEGSVDFLHTYSGDFAKERDVEDFYQRVDCYKKMFDKFNNS